MPPGLIKDSFTLAEILKFLESTKNITLILFDIPSLFTSIPGTLINKKGHYHLLDTSRSEDVLTRRIRFIFNFDSLSSPIISTKKVMVVLLGLHRSYYCKSYLTVT